MSEYFKLSEFLASDTARKKGIDNTPSFEVVASLEELAEVLDGIRAAWGSGIRVTSGYRCPELNKAVGGVANSGHLRGVSADLQPVNGRQTDFNKFVIAYVASAGVKFDQLIKEKSGASDWLHISLWSDKWQQRGQILNIEK